MRTRTPSVSGEPRLQAETLGALGAASFSAGLGFRRDLFERAVELEERSGFLPATDRPMAVYGWCAKWAGDIELGRGLLERVAADALACEDATADAPLFYLSWLHIIAGEWDWAVERAQESLDLSLDAGLGASVGPGVDRPRRRRCSPRAAPGGRGPARRSSGPRGGAGAVVRVHPCTNRLCGRGRGLDRRRAREGFRSR